MPLLPRPAAEATSKKGWTIPWYSTNDGDFSYDYGATIDASRGYDEFNYRTLDEYAAMGQESMGQRQDVWVGAADRRERRRWA